MEYFADISFYGFNHFANHTEVVDGVFKTHALNFLSSGRLLWQMDRGPAMEIAAPAAYWTWPGPRFSYHAIGPTPWTHRYVSVTGPRTARWTERGLFLTKRISPPVMTIVDASRFQRDFDALLATLDTMPVHNPEAVLLLEGLLLQIQTQPTREVVVHPRREEMCALIRRIELTPEEETDFAVEAEQMHITPTHLRRLFKLFTGDTPVSFLNRQRLTRAAQYLRSSDRAIKQIALDVGMPDVFYFTRRFAHHHGMPPARYRKTYQTTELR
jgi:AraC-like DNA-binding protein